MKPQTVLTELTLGLKYNMAIKLWFNLESREGYDGLFKIKAMIIVNVHSGDW